MRTQYDVVVIGAGSAGLTSAVGLTKVGKRVLLIEREQLGGECTNSGCIPSKALLHHAKAFYAAKKFGGPSEHSEAFRREAFTYVRRVIDEILVEETPAVFKEMGIDVILGEATFTSRHSVTVAGTAYSFKKAIITTGSSPRLLEVPGLDTSYVLTNQNLFTLSEIPKQLLIIGGGPIGLEMAQAFAMLGSQVTIVERGDELARLEDPAIRKIIHTSFNELGIRVETNAEITASDDTTATFTNRTSNKTFTVDFDKVLVAIGRVPNLPTGLNEAGITFDQACIQVDGQYRTSNKNVYAVGDVAQQQKFTHTADDVARQVVARIASRGVLRVNTRKAVPKVTYTEPEIAQVGMLEAEALEKYGSERIKRIDVPYTLNDRAKTDEQTTGHLVVTVRRLNGAILGANIIGPAAGEIIAIFTLAIDRKISLWQLRQLIFAYPTYSLVVRKAGDLFFAEQIASLKQDLINVLKRNAPKLIGGSFWLALLIAFTHYRLSNDLSYLDMLFMLIDFFTMSMWGPLTYMVLYAVRPLIFFPATLLTALSGALFGPVLGILYTVIGENASANLAYWVGRFFGADLKLEDTVIGNLVEKLRKNTFGAVLFMRLAYFPFDLTNYGAGIVRAKWREYFLATLIGIMPGLTVFVLLGASLDLSEFQTTGLSFDLFDPRFLALSLGIFVASLGLAKFLKRWRAE